MRVVKAYTAEEEIVRRIYLRVLLWNCNNGLGQQAQLEQFQSFNCDVAVIPELKEANIEPINPDFAIWVTNNFGARRPKGLGVLTFNGWNLKSLPRDEEMEIYLPVEISKGEFSFNLLAVWNFYHACKSGRFKGVRGENALEWEAMRHYKHLFSDPALVVGDWNFGPTFSKEAFVELVSVFEESDMRSLYHDYFSLKPDQTKHSTFLTTRNTKHHLDHMFGSTSFFSKMKRFEILDLTDVVLSDHAPCFLEIEDV